jgi:hypothetical protein
MKLAKGKVSFSIKLTAFQASGWAYTRNLYYLLITTLAALIGAAS